MWFNNVPHTRLVEDKGGQNWIFKENDKFKFPGGGTQFIHGADQHLDQISNVSWVCLRNKVILFASLDSEVTLFLFLYIDDS